MTGVFRNAGSGRLSSDRQSREPPRLALMAAAIMLGLILLIWWAVWITLIGPTEQEHSQIAATPQAIRIQAMPIPSQTPAATQVMPAPVTHSSTPKTATAARVGSPAAGPTDLVALITATFPEDPARAVRIARCESAGFRPDVVYGPTRGRQGELGAMQLHPRYHRHRWEARGWSDAQMFDPVKNLAIAREIFLESGGWGPWACRGA